MCKCPYLGHKNSQDIPLYQAPDIIAPKIKAQQCELQPRFEITPSRYFLESGLRSVFPTAN